MSTGTDLDVVMPQMGVSVSEGTVTRWLRGVGDTVASDESLLEISTDKVDTEVPSPGSGVLREILVFEGETVSVGTVLARIDGAAQPEPAALHREPEPPAPPAVSAAPPPLDEEPDLSDRPAPELAAVRAEESDLFDRPAPEPAAVSAEGTRERGAQLHLARRRANLGRARHRPLDTRGQRSGGARDQEGRPRLRGDALPDSGAVGCDAGCDTGGGGADRHTERYSTRTAAYPPGLRRRRRPPASARGAREPSSLPARASNR